MTTRCFSRSARRCLAGAALCLLASCAQLPRQGQTSAAAGAMGYALEGPAQGPVVVLQSGLGDGRATWQPLWPALTARHRVFAADRPGYGDSPASSAARTPCQAARELHTALHELQLPPPYLLVGHSLGGLYQVAFARLYPQETAGLLLLDPTHPDHAARLQRDAPAAAALLSGLRATLFTPVMRAEFDAQTQCLDSLPPWPTGLPARLLFSSRFSAVESEDYQRMLWSLRQDWQRQLAAPAETVPGAGHYLHHDAPARVVQALEHLRDAPSTAPLR